MSLRTERLKEIIRERAADFVLYRLGDPRVGFCTVTKVNLAGDLSEATIHISVLGDEEDKRTTMRGLNKACGLLQSHVAAGLRTRTTPRITIELDETAEKSVALLRKIKQARASDPDGGRSVSEDNGAAETEEYSS